MPSQSPINGSTKHNTSTRLITASGSHQRQARQNEKTGAGAGTRGRFILLLLSAPASWLSRVFVVRGIWINELSFDRLVRSLNHLYAITLSIVLNFVHDVVAEADSAACGAEQSGGVPSV